MSDESTVTPQPTAEPSGSDSFGAFETAAPPEPQGQPEPTAPIPAEPAPTAAPPAAGPPGGQPSLAPTAPPERKVKIRGQEYSLSELTGKPELLEALATTAEQFPHIQGKYQELLERIAKAQQEPQKPPPPPQQPQTPPSPAHYQAIYGPRAAELAKTGLVEEDMVAAYPNFVNQALAIADEVATVQQTVQAIRGFLIQMGQGQARTSVSTNLNTMTDSLANSGEEMFKPLADRGERDKFFDYLANRVNPPVEMLNPEFLAAQWFAYKQKELAETLKQARNLAQQTTEQKRQQAAGQPPSPRTPQTPMSALEKELREFEASG